jgi:hypothetical protein
VKDEIAIMKINIAPLGILKSSFYVILPKKIISARETIS